MPRDNEKLIDIGKAIIIGISLVLLSVACFLSFISMGLIVTLFFIPTISYFSPFMMPLLLSLFLFMGQLVPGYFSPNKFYLLVPLIFIGALVGILFTMLMGYKGIIYGASCAFGCKTGFIIRKKME